MGVENDGDGEEAGEGEVGQHPRHQAAHQTHLVADLQYGVQKTVKEGTADLCHVVRVESAGLGEEEGGGGGEDDDAGEAGQEKEQQQHQFAEGGAGRLGQLSREFSSQTNLNPEVNPESKYWP